jgi:hypothetical protein
VSGYLLRSRPEEAPPRAAPKGRALAFDLMADLYGNSAERSWKRVKPWVQKERARRNNATYLPNSEQFAKKCIKYNAQKHGEELQTFRRATQPSSGKRRISWRRADRG